MLHSKEGSIAHLIVFDRGGASTFQDLVAPRGRYGGDVSINQGALIVNLIREWGTK